MDFDPTELQRPGIYMLTNQVNGKRYIGQSVNLARRSRQHFRANRKSALHRAIIKYGAENFSFDVVEFCDIADLDRLETLYIAYADCVAPKGYNLQAEAKGSRGRVVSDETRTRMSESRRGRKYSEATCAKIGAIHRGKKLSDETKEKLRIAHTGKTASDAVKEKMSQAKKGE